MQEMTILIRGSRYASSSMSVRRSAYSSAAPAAVDSHGREVRSLRLSVTQRCDLACSHCHHEGQAPASEEMTAAEIAKIVRVASRLGVRKVKLTGGEPLLRVDICDIVASISPLVSEVSLTTNGSNLFEMAGPLKSAGLHRINVSLHTLDQQRYERLCGVDIVDKVVEGIASAVEAGLSPVKVNMVVLKDLNVQDISPMIDFCGNVGAILQLIEYMADKDEANGRQFAEKFYSLKDTETMLAKRASGFSVNEIHRRRKYHVDNNGRPVTVEVVRPMHNTEFCANCTRIRVSSDGKVTPCLMDRSGTVDLLTPLRQGADDASLAELYLKCVANRRPYWS